jgi:hypothetical protein
MHELMIQAYHGLIIKGERLHLPHGIRGRLNILKNNPSLPFVFQCLECQYLQYLPELREHSVQSFLQLFFFLVFKSDITT